jgi:hypothetical protein
VDLPSCPSVSPGNKSIGAGYWKNSLQRARQRRGAILTTRMCKRYSITIGKSTIVGRFNTFFAAAQQEFEPTYIITTLASTGSMPT